MRTTWICYWCEKEQDTDGFPAPMQKCEECIKPLEEVRAKVIEAVPEILSDCILCGDSKEEPECGLSGKHVVQARSVQLADVLRAIEVSEDAVCCGINFHSDGAYLYYDDMENSEAVKIDFSTSLENWSPEVISFLHKIIV